MDAKELNALVHDREAAFYDERFALRYDASIGMIVRRDLARVLGRAPEPVQTALDFCCGTGFASIGLAVAGLAKHVHGCDLSKQMLECTRANAKRAGVDVALALCDGEALPYADGTFDLIVARGALHHLPSPVDALREARRVLAPGGAVVVLAEPTPAGERQVAAVVGNLARVVEATRKALRRPIDAEHHHWELASMAANLHTFTPQDLEKIAIEAGFEDITTGTAWWGWVLALGLNYYAAGESKRIANNRLLRKARELTVDAANTADRLLIERLIPAQWRHTVQAVLR